MSARRPTVLGLLALVLGAGGCLGVLEPVDPAVGPALAARCTQEDSDPGTAVSFTRDVLPLLKGEAGPVGCGCHFPGSKTPIGIEQAGLDLSSYASLRAGGVRSRAAIVVAGRPCDSILVQKIGEAPPVGARMPFDGPPFLSDAERQLIADWIAEGAGDN